MCCFQCLMQEFNVGNQSKMDYFLTGNHSQTLLSCLIFNTTCSRKAPGQCTIQSLQTCNLYLQALQNQITYMTGLSCTICVKVCHPCSVAAAHISFADVSTSAVCYQYSPVMQVLKRLHNAHLLCYQFVVVMCVHTCCCVSVSTQTSLSHFSRGTEPELYKLRNRQRRGGGICGI